MKDDICPLGGSTLGEKFDATARGFVTVDVQKYQHFLDETDMTDEQKAEFLQALWSIMVTFVELGFRVHPLQEVCGKGGQAAIPSATDAFNQVDSAEANNARKLTDSGPSGGLEVK